MIQVSIKSNFPIDCILSSQEVLSFTYHTYKTGNYMFKVNSKNASNASNAKNAVFLTIIIPFKGFISG